MKSIVTFIFSIFLISLLSNCGGTTNNANILARDYLNTMSPSLPYDDVNLSPSITWSKSVHNPLGNFFYDISTDSYDHHYAVGFTEFNTEDIDNYAMILKVDNRGTKLWHKKFGGSKSDSFVGLTIDSDDFIYAVGMSSSQDGDIIDQKSGTYLNALIVKYDSKGDVQWSHTFGKEEFGEFNDAITDSQHNIYAVGGAGINREAYNALIVKYDDQGHLIWNKIIESSDYHVLLDTVVDTDDNIYAVGQIIINGNKSGYLIKLDAAGNILWDKKIGGTGLDELYGITINQYNDIYVVGTTSSMDGDITDKDNTSYDALIVKVDTEGQILWTKTIGSQYRDVFSRIYTDKNDNHYAVGLTRLTSKEFIEGDINIRNGLIVKINNDNNTTMKVISASNTETILYSITSDSLNNLYSVGTYVNFNTLSDSTYIRDRTKEAIILKTPDI